MEYRRRTSRRYESSKKNKKVSLFRKIISIIAVLVLSGIISVGIAFALLVDTSSWESFDPDSLTNVNQTLYVYDVNGVEVAGVYNQENRTYVSLDYIPDHVVKAFVAIEDARFYEHDGIDYIRMFGSMWANLKSMSFSQGFSTISQQLIKNTHLSSEKTINRKVQEMYLAIKLEQEYTKDEIMEMYLNYIYFGNGAYGIEAAARSYFDKDVSQLTISEGAMLAGVIKSTANYAPHLDFEKSMSRRDIVLKQMYSNEFITEQEYQEALQDTPVLVVSRPSNTEYGQFVDYALDEASSILNMSYEEMTASGYKIYTTMDAKLQMAVQNHFQDSELFPEDASDGVQAEGAAVVLDAQTGAVKVLIAGRNYAAKGMNRAIDARRQPGSTIKTVLVYGPAIDQFGYTGASLIEDKPIDINGYAPNNYDGEFSGWVSLREAVALSINIPAVLIFNDIGVENGIAYAKASGIPFYEGDDNLSLALGGFTYGVTPLELAASYQPYANQGVYNEPYVVKRIEDSYGKVLYEHSPESIQIVESSTAFMMTNILQTTVELGTAKRLAIDGIEIAAKTGTVSFQSGRGVNDAWTAAYTTEDIVVVWNGFDMPSDIHYMSSSSTGGRYPALMIKEIFEDIYASHTPADFPDDDGVVSVKLDKIMYERYNTIALATEYTTNGNYFYEYFKADNMPVNESPFWSEPYKVTDLTGYIDEEGNPVISFTPLQEYMIYSLIRQEDYEESSSAFVVATYSGVTDMVYFTDTEADNAEYKYYVAVYNPVVILENNTFLYGESSDYVKLDVPQRVVEEPTEQPEATPEPVSSPFPEPEITPSPEISPTPSPTTEGVG